LKYNTPADGMVSGIGSVNGHLFPEEKSRCVVCAYDYTVLAGTQVLDLSHPSLLCLSLSSSSPPTQGIFNHMKKDRVFEIAKQWRIPCVFFTEGGGGRPGDTDAAGVSGAGLACSSFTAWAQLSGLVPLVGITTGYCFAGNAVLLGCCDVIIATQDAHIG
jgi:acetyl-CoA carboxylase carboxyltransferase component